LCFNSGKKYSLFVMYNNNIKILLFFILVSYSSISAQNKYNNKYSLPVISNLQTYKEQAIKDSNNTLVDVKRYIPSLKLDIRYAGNNNFFKEPVYNYARAFLRLPAVKALRRIQKELNKAGLGLKIVDAYRPYSATVKFYDKIKDTQYVAAPWTGSRHNRGCAADLTLIDLKTGKELVMPTGFDSFSEEAHSDYINLSPEKIKNRDLLIGVMVKYGFENLLSE
jgi:zinc D-Ala-D-Ala dipeptidase